MKAQLLLVDFENIQKINLAQLKGRYHVVIFVGAQQKSVPTELLLSAQKLEGKLEWQQIEGTGKNALDFHIACYLGQLLERKYQRKCTILSKDKGFDPLIKYLNKNGLECKRVENLIEQDARFELVSKPDYKRVIDILKKADIRSRPSKKASLSHAILAMHQKKITQQDADNIVDELFAHQLIFESNNRLSYTF